MPRERKILIETGSILSGPDTLSRVISRDREQSGRQPPPPPDKDTPDHDAPEDNLQQDSLQEINLTNLQESLQDNLKPSKQDIKEEDKQDIRQMGSQPSEREERLAKAMEVAAEDEMIVVSVRVSAKLNDYIDQYVARVAKANPKRRYRKQDAMAAALAGFVADHPMPARSVEEHF